MIRCFLSDKRRYILQIFKGILTVIFVIIGIALTTIVLLQEGKSAGLSGSISGAAESYWGKNKARSMEGRLERITTYLVILFLLIAIVLNINL